MATSIITDEMIELIGQAILCFVATVNEDNTPNLSPKASLTARDGALFFANIASPATVKNLRRNPAIEINVVDIFRRRGFRFRGRATIISPGAPDYDAIAGWVWRTNGKAYPVHDVVKVDIEEARPVLSPAYVYGDGTTEQNLRIAFLEKYGVQPASKGGLS